ncbi:MAG: hypothetical protein ACXVLQ_05385 [Bacteriovorax sp.]
MQNKSISGQHYSQVPMPIQHEEKILFLESRIKKLGDICNELNPYEPIDEAFRIRLREFNIMELEDPFKVTNALLMLLEDTIDELHVLKPVDETEKFR